MEIAIIIIFIVGIIVMRLFGAWMLRIDEVIKNQKEIIKVLRKNNDLQSNVINSLTKKVE